MGKLVTQHIRRITKQLDNLNIPEVALPGTNHADNPDVWSDKTIYTGELAINVNSGKLYTSDGKNIVEISKDTQIASGLQVLAPAAASAGEGGCPIPLTLQVTSGYAKILGKTYIHNTAAPGSGDVELLPTDGSGGRYDLIYAIPSDIKYNESDVFYRASIVAIPGPTDFMNFFEGQNNYLPTVIIEGIPEILSIDECLLLAIVWIPASYTTGSPHKLRPWSWSCDNDKDIRKFNLLHAQTLPIMAITPAYLIDYLQQHIFSHHEPLGGDYRDTRVYLEDQTLFFDNLNQSNPDTKMYRVLNTHFCKSLADSIANNNIVEISGSGGSGGSSVSATNEILINTVDDEVIGKQYKTFANAFTYISAQNPSSGNTWAVRFSGIITENLMIPEFVTVVGDDMYTSIIDGIVAFEALGTQLLNTNNICNCTISNLIATSTTSPIIATVDTTIPYNPSTRFFVFSTSPTTGTYTITGDGFTTAPIAYNATIGDIQAAIRLANITFSEITVIGDDPLVSFEVILNGFASSNLAVWTGTNVDLDGGITLSVGTTHPTPQQQTISFDEVGVGNWLINLEYDGTTYTCSNPIVNNNDSGNDILAAIQDIFAQILADKGVDLSAANIETGGSYNEYIINLINVVRSINQITVTNVDLIFYNSQFIGVDNCKILSAFGTGVNGIIANTCQILGGDFSTFNKLCFITNCFIIPLFGIISFYQANIFMSLLYALSPSSILMNRCNVNQSMINSFENIVFSGNTSSTIEYSSIDASGVATTIATDLNIENSTIRISSGSLTVNSGVTFVTRSCIIDVVPIVTPGGTWNNIGNLYDNRSSGLVSSDTQSAIDELASDTKVMVGYWDNDQQFEDIYDKYNMDSRIEPIHIICFRTNLFNPIFAWKPRSVGSYDSSKIALMSFAFPEINTGYTNKIIISDDWTGVQMTAMPISLTNLYIENSVSTNVPPFALSSGTSTTRLNTSNLSQGNTAQAPLIQLLPGAPGGSLYFYLEKESMLMNGGNINPLIKINNTINAGTIMVELHTSSSLSNADVVSDTLTLPCSSTSWILLDSSSSYLTQTNMLTEIISLLDNSTKVEYSNSISGLTATTVQGAIDELARPPIFFDDFLGSQHVGWTPDEAQGSSSYPTDVLNGCVTDITTGTNGDIISYNFGDKCYFHQDHNITMEVRLKLNTLEKIKVNIGLISTSGHFIKIEHNSIVDSHWVISIYNGGSTYALNCGLATSDMTTLKFTVLNGNTLSVYYNGSFENSTTFPVASTEFFQIFREIETQENATKSYDIDYVKIYQDRS